MADEFLERSERQLSGQICGLHVKRDVARHGNLSRNDWRRGSRLQRGGIRQRLRCTQVGCQFCRRFEASSSSVR